MRRARVRRIVLTLLVLGLAGPTGHAGGTSSDLGPNGQHRRPFYIVGHNPNTAAEALADLQAGANALEPDVMRFSDTARYYVDRTLNSEAGPSGLFMYHDSVEVTSRMPETVEDYLDRVHDLVKDGHNVALIAFDIKTPAAKSAYGASLQTAVREHLNKDGVHVNVIYSVADFTDTDVFESIVPNLAANEGVMIDGTNDPIKVYNHFIDQINALNVAKPAGEPWIPYNIGYGNGSAGESLGAAPNVILSMDRASWARVSQGLGLAIPYAFPIDGKSRMSEYVNAGVDGLIPDADVLAPPAAATTLEIGWLSELVAARSDVYLATVNDNPFRPALEGYALAVETLPNTLLSSHGTDSDLTFTLKGCNGQASVTYDASYSSRFEAGRTDFVTIPSKDLGVLESLTLSKDDSGISPDWDPGTIKISSWKYNIAYPGISVTATDTVSGDAPQTLTLPGGHGNSCDRTPPHASPTIDLTPNAAGWYRGDVTVTWNWSDTGGSGIAPTACTSSSTSSGEGGSIALTATCKDGAGNTGTASTIVRVDKTPPTLSFGSLSPAPNASGWNNTDVSVAFTTADNLSGVAGTTLPSPLVFTAPGVSVSRSVTVTDQAGNSASFSSPAVNLDKTAPTVTFGARSPAANAAGWNNADVSVSFTTADDLSGVAGTSPASPLRFTTEGGGQTRIVTVTDVAGNDASYTSPTVSLDKTSPTLTFGALAPAPNASGWNNADVSVPFATADNLSGVAGTSVPSPLAFTTEGGGQTRIVAVTDVAGNSASFMSPAVNLDRTAPVVTCSASPDVLWPVTNRLRAVTFAVDVEDALSGAGPFTLTAATANEPLGPGDISSLTIGTADTSGDLRASRLGYGDGRVYSVTYRGLDVAGNATLCLVTVTVPHDSSR
jgi:hypothetical protein